MNKSVKSATSGFVAPGYGQADLASLYGASVMNLPESLTLSPTYGLDTAALFDLPKPASKCRIVVAMSGGVDSSVVAALAADTGAEVIGITLQLYDYGAATGRKGACCAGDDIADARAVSDRLGIAHYVFDHESAFKEEVVDQFADEYLAGRTPVPCIRCNMGPKFTDLFRMARELGADCLATGHYVRRVEADDGPHLYRANDPTRDQSYFLYATTQEQLDYIRFPLGGLPKTQVRELAEAAGLRNAMKPDSQDICFVPDGNYAKIVTKLRPEGGVPGKIVHAATGETLGEHKGIVHYTVGQRKGLDIGGQPQPLYVIKLDAETREVRVGPKRMLAVESAEVIETNCIGTISEGTQLTAKVRSLAKPVPITLEGPLGDGASTRIRFVTPEFGVAPGQAAVIYADERVIGGGWIDSTTSVAS
jgi:tRNA-specific 2-thiouridylase